MAEAGNHSKLRLEWLDALKGVAILSVVLGHILLGYTGNNMFPEVNATMLELMKWIYIWHMPLFMAISGFSFSVAYINEQKINKRKIVRGGVNLFLLYLIFSIVLGVLKIWFATLVDHPMDARELCISLVLPNNLIWYLWVLLAYYFAFGVVMSRNVSQVFLVVILVTLVFVGRILAEPLALRLCVKNLFCYALYFDIGICFGAGQLRQNKVSGKWVMRIAILTALLLSGLFVACFDIYEELPLVCKTLFETCYALSIVILLFGVFSSVVVTGAVKGLAQLGKSSLVIYLIHTYIVTAIKVAVKKSEFHNALVAVLYAWCIAVAISYLLFLMSRRVRLIGWIFKPILGVDWLLRRTLKKTKKEVIYHGCHCVFNISDSLADKSGDVQE